MPSKNYVERTHTTNKIEFGLGAGGKFGGSISLNLDNQTREISFTGCLSIGISVGEVKGVFQFSENESGGVADSLQPSGSNTYNVIVGAGIAYKVSYDLNNTGLETTQSTPNESVYTVFGAGIDFTAERCLEANPKGILRELRELLDKIIDRSFDSDKDSIFDKDTSSSDKKLGSKDGRNSLGDAKDSFHGGRESGFGGLADGRSLGERPEREHFRA